MNAISKYRELMEYQKFDEDSFSKLNWEKRKKIVNYAYENTEFYKKNTMILVDFVLQYLLKGVIEIKSRFWSVQ
jgi:phosphopantetheinyl transferase